MKDLVKTGVWENRTTWQDAVAFAQSDPDGVAIWFDDGSELTYRQGCEEAITLAASLTELSLRKGDRKSDVKGTSVSVRVDSGGSRSSKKKKENDEKAVRQGNLVQ